jgi:hypothetical protein
LLASLSVLPAEAERRDKKASPSASLKRTDVRKISAFEIFLLMRYNIPEKKPL